MIYVMSDLHGRYDLYKRMLERISFSDSDTLYILGDFVDRGEEGFKIIFDIAERENVIPLVGNHDLIAAVVLSKLNRGVTSAQLADLREVLDAWILDGGRTTFDEFKALSHEERRHALMIMEDFRTYAEVAVGGREYVLCHAGIAGYEEGTPLSDYALEDFVTERTDYSTPIFSGNRYLVTGHTPTAAIEGATEGRIYRANNYIAIDCGAVFDLGLGCLCLDTDEEFYVI